MTSNGEVVVPRVEAVLIEPVPGLTPADLVEFGALGRELGLGTLETRALTQELQEIATRAVMAAVPKAFERVRKVQEARLAELLMRLRMQTNIMGYISRDTVFTLISQVMNQAPRN
jgi:hypothetical protein